MPDVTVLNSYQAVYSREHKEIESILIGLPLINVPVKTPHLLADLQFKVLYASMDSYAILRSYLTAMRAFQLKPLIPRKTDTCLAWFSEKITKGTLEFRELSEFAANSHWKTETFTHLDYLADSLREGKLTTTVFLEKCKDLVSVDEYGAPWSTGTIFTEDVVKAMTKETATLQDWLSEHFELLKDLENEAKYHGTCNVIHAGTIRLLNIYEKALITIVHRKPYNEEFADLLTEEVDYEPRRFGDKVCSDVAENRQGLMEDRKGKEEVIEITLDAVPAETKGMPTVDELNTYISFFQWPIKC